MDKKSVSLPKGYWRKNLPFICVNIAVIIAREFTDSRNRIYLTLALFILLAAWFTLQKKWSFADWRGRCKAGKQFWVPVVCTVLGLATAFALGGLLAALLPGIADGWAAYRVDSWWSLCTFALATVLLPPFAEELFYRQALIYTGNKGAVWITACLSVALFALSHSVFPLGFIRGVLLALPFTVAYIKTGDIYMTMTAHLLTNLVMNGSTVVVIAWQLLLEK